MTGDYFVVTTASAGDVHGVIALIGRVFAEYGFIFDAAVEVPDLHAFASTTRPPPGAFYVVRKDAMVVGTVGVERLDARRAELHRLYLDAARERGLGRALVEAVLDWCRAQDVPRLVLWSDTRFDLAHRLYARMGFRHTGGAHPARGRERYARARLRADGVGGRMLQIVPRRRGVPEQFL